MYAIYSYGYWAMGYGDNIHPEEKVFIEPNRKYHVVSTVNSQLRRCVVDDVEVVCKEEVKTVKNNSNLYLFDSCRNETVAGGSSQTRLYWMKIRKENVNGEMELVRDFRPAKVNNRYGLYDAVSERLFAANPGAPQFSRESMIAESTKPIPAPRPKSYLEFVELACVTDGVPGLYDLASGHFTCEEKALGVVDRLVLPPPEHAYPGFLNSP